MASPAQKTSANDQADAALRVSEATRSAILQTALDCIVTIDHQGMVVDWNPAAEKTFGYTHSEALGREMAELIIPPAMQEMHRRGLARAVASGHDAMAGKRVEITARRKTGEEFPVELAITRIAAGPNPLFTGHIRDISERKQVERSLRESQQLLSSITQNLTEAIFRRSIREGLLFVNESYLRMFGYASAEDLRRVPPERLYADPGRRAEIVRRLEHDGGFHNEEIHYRRRDGTTFWGLTSATGIYDESSRRILYFDGAINDIAERKHAERLQAAQHAVTRVLAEAANLIEATPKILRAVGESLEWDLGTLWRVDAASKSLRCVQVWHAPKVRGADFVSATRRASFAPGLGLPGRIWSANEPCWIPDVTQDINFPRADRAKRCGFHGAFGFPVRLGAEVLGVVEFFSREIRQPNTDVLAMFAAIGSQIGQFIQRKQAEESLRTLNQELEERVTQRTAALQESESRLRTVTERTPAAIVLLDTDTGRFVEANENAVALFGLSRKKLLALGPVDLSPKFQPDGAASAASARKKIGSALSGDFPVFEWTHRHASGRAIPCEVRVARIPAAGRNLVIGAIMDITARKAAEAELHAALEQEKELSRLKTNFVNVVSHEFRTPLGVIMSSAEILESYFDRLQPEQRTGHLQDIRHATHQMTRLMEEVLLLGRVESGRMEYKPEALDLPGFCRRLVDEQLSASNRKCPIVLDLQRFAGQARGDEGLMRHIFTNLLSNAVKYSTRGSPVRFRVTQAGAEAAFEIRDQGIGIVAEDQGRLFEAFHRGRNVGDIPGTGLGLVIVKRCVELHHGTMDLSSAPESGTTVIVRLDLFGTESLKRRKRTAKRA